MYRSNSQAAPPLIVDNSEYDRRVRDYHHEWTEISVSFNIPTAMAHDSGLELIEAE